MSCSFLGQPTRQLELKMLTPTISLIIPAFNEEKNIGDVISQVGRLMKSYFLPCEVIVVDDGSTDRTKEVAHQNGVIVLSNGKNQGKGCALQRGFRYAHGDIIVTMDADGAHDPEDLKRLILPILNGADVVFGSRFVDGNGKDSTKRLHILGNNLINFLILLMTGKHITDSQTGFRAFRRKIVQDIEIVSKGYEVETEFTVKTLRNGNVVQEVPILIRKRMSGQSHVNPLFDGLRIFKVIAKASLA